MVAPFFYAAFPKVCSLHHRRALLAFQHPILIGHHMGLAIGEKVDPFAVTLIRLIAAGVPDAAWKNIRANSMPLAFLIFTLIDRPIRGGKEPLSMFTAILEPALIGRAIAQSQTTDAVDAVPLNTLAGYAVRKGNLPILIVGAILEYPFKP